MVQAVRVMDYDEFSRDLEWFIRLLKEPRRLWKRYMVYSPLLFIHMLDL